LSRFANFLKTSLSASGLAGVSAGTATSELMLLLSNMIGNNDCLTKHIKTIAPLIKMNDSLYFNQNNNNFTLNNFNEIELHSKYTDLIDWKLKINSDIITYNEKIYIIGSLGLGSTHTLHTHKHYIHTHTLHTHTHTNGKKRLVC